MNNVTEKFSKILQNWQINIKINWPDKLISSTATLVDRFDRTSTTENGFIIKSWIRYTAHNTQTYDRISTHWDIMFNALITYI